MVDTWNEHIGEVFIPGWLSYLDEPIFIWTSRCTCPGFMFVTRKPHTIGTEYHSICCDLSEIMRGIETVEANDTPRERRKPKFHVNGKTG